jgi:4-amino-4-deoxy-L-arabinose transferase-like glycosyltransferase
MVSLEQICESLRLRSTAMPRSFWAITGLFVLANVLLGWFTVPGANLAQGGDAGSYWDPALALLKHGGFVQLDNPTEANLYRTPLYPLLIAAILSLTGEAPVAVVIVQLILLYGAGLFFRDSVKDWLPGWENLGMGLILLNPNLLGTAHLIQSETLYLFCMTVAFWALLKIVRADFRWRNAVISGGALAAACLVKPTSQFLVPLLPVALPLIAYVSGARSECRLALIQGFVAMALALAIMAPWAAKMAEAGNGYALSDHSIRYRFLWDQVTMLEANALGLNYHDAGKRITAPGTYHAAVINSYGDGWKKLPEVERYAILERHGYNAIFSYPPGVIFRTMMRSVAQFMASGGAGNWHNLLGVDTARMNRVWFKASQSDVGGMLKMFSGEASLSALVLSAFCLGFAVIARLVGFAGFVSLIRKKEFALLMVLVGLIGYFVAVHLFHGNSRYRIPVEPAMMMLVLYGLQAMTLWYAEWRRTKAAESP